jgi:hypothetical protein
LVWQRFTISSGENAVENFNNGYQQFLTIDTQADDFWEQADRFVDMEYYTDYICAQTWIADTDWPFNNIKIHRAPETGNRWRFSLVDLEWSLRGGNAWTDSWYDHINYILHYDNSYPYIHIWQKAMENVKYRNYFINRLADLMNSAWKADRLKEIANEIYEQTRPELPSTYKRWGNGASVNAYLNQFDAAHRTLLSEFENRSGNVQSHIVNNFGLAKTVELVLNVEPAGCGYIKINTIQPNEYPWTGIYFDGIPVKIEAVAKTGYKFDHWDKNVFISNTGQALFEGNLTSKVTFKANFVENADTTLVAISEINYNSEPSVDADDWIELWNFSTSKDADISGWKITDEDTLHVFTFPQNTIIKPGKRIVVVRDEKAFNDLYSGIDDIPGLGFGLGSKSDAVRLFNAQSELVSEVYYADSLPWPIGAGGQGRTMELLDPRNPSNDPSNWFDGCIGGSPVKPILHVANLLYFQKSILIVMMLLIPKIGWNCEIRVNQPSIFRMKFMDDKDSLTHEFYIPNGTILAPQQNMVLAQDLTSFKSFHPDIPNVLGPFNFSLSNGGEWIRMYDKSEKIRLSVRYNDKSPWPKKADGDGFTLELIDSTGLMNDGRNWFAGCYGVPRRLLFLTM